MEPESNEYKVTWTVDVEADDPVEAAREALRIQRDPESVATYFEVQKHGSDVVFPVDLEDMEP